MICGGRSLLGRAGVLISGPSPLVPKFPSQCNFSDNGHMAFGTSQGFLNFPKTKYLGGDSIIWQSCPCLALLDLNRFSIMICRIWTLWCLSVSHYTYETRFRTVIGVRTVGPIRTFQKGGAKKSSYSMQIRFQNFSIPLLIVKSGSGVLLCSSYFFFKRLSSHWRALISSIKVGSTVMLASSLLIFRETRVHAKPLVIFWLSASATTLAFPGW